MTPQASPTYTAQIVMAGDIAQAKAICRRYCFDVGLCVTIEPVDYIYTGGEEAGFRVGLINYPRFPSEPAQILAHAEALLLLLVDGLSQHSASIITSTETLWFSRRPS